MIAALTALDSSPLLGRIRDRVHAGGRHVAFVVDSGCIAFAILTGLTFSLAGFDLVAAARLWGSFWTHYADASAEARRPVLITMLSVWLAVTVLTALIRATGKRGPKPAQDRLND